MSLRSSGMMKLLQDHNEFDTFVVPPYEDEEKNSVTFFALKGQGIQPEVSTSGPEASAPSSP